MGFLFRLSRVAQARRSVPPSRGPAEGSAEGVSDEAELACLPRVGRLPLSEAEMWRLAGGLGGEASSEAEIAPRVRKGPRMGRTTKLGHGPSADRPTWEPRQDLGVVGGLEELRGVRVQNNDGVVIISGFFLSRIAIE